MPDYMRLYSSTWRSGSDFLDLTRDAQWLYWALGSQPNISNCGVLPLTPGRWSKLAADTDADSVRRYLDQLVTADKIAVDEQTEEVWVRAYMKRDGLARLNINGLKSVRRAVAEVLSDVLRERITNELARVLETPPEWLAKQGETVDGTVDGTVERPQQPAASSRGLHPSPAAAAPPSGELPAAAADALSIYIAWRESTETTIRNPDRWRAKLRRDELAAHKGELIAGALDGEDAETLATCVWGMDPSALITGRHYARTGAA